MMSSLFLKTILLYAAILIKTNSYPDLIYKSQSRGTGFWYIYYSVIRSQIIFENSTGFSMEIPSIRRACV